MTSTDRESERLTALGGLAALSLDALSSVAYGPEAILVVLVTAGASALRYSLPVTIAIVVLLAALVISYRQVIEAFPNGGGAYAVSQRHLGRVPSLVAAASLIVDYVLNAAVGVSAGVEALTAAFPGLYGARVWLCLAVLALITAVNLWGVAESARVFMVPTIAFVVAIFLVIAVGLLRAHPAVPLSRTLPQATDTVGVLLVLKAFASGCSALTGVEAIANSVPQFRLPARHHPGAGDPPGDEQRGAVPPAVPAGGARRGAGRRARGPRRGGARRRRRARRRKRDAGRRRRPARGGRALTGDARRRPRHTAWNARRWQDMCHGPLGAGAVSTPVRGAQPVAVVTGASRGVGLEVCRQLAALGYLVVLGSRDLRRAELAAKELDPEGERIVPARIEVDNSVNVEQFAQWVRERFGRVDAIVNNASTAPDQYGIAGTTDLSPVAEALDVNLFGAWRVIQALLPLLRSSPRPRIVNVSSEKGSIALMSGGRPALSVSKAALNALTRTLAGELYRDGILVNAVCPGQVTADGALGSRRSAAQGAASVVWAITLPNGGPTGTFTRDGRELPW